MYSNKRDRLQRLKIKPSVFRNPYSISNSDKKMVPLNLPCTRDRPGAVWYFPKSVTLKNSAEHVSSWSACLCAFMKKNKQTPNIEKRIIETNVPDASCHKVIHRRPQIQPENSHAGSQDANVRGLGSPAVANMTSTLTLAIVVAP